MLRIQIAWSSRRWCLLGACFFVGFSDARSDTIAPYVTGGTIDLAPELGVADQVSSSSLIANGANGEYRAIIEYDVRDFLSGTVVSASITGSVVPNNSLDVGTREHVVEIFTGDGVISLGDHSVAGIEVGRLSHPSGGTSDFDLDVGAVLQNLLAAGADFIGVRISPVTDPLPFDLLSTSQFYNPPRLHFEINPSNSMTQQFIPVVDASVELTDGTYVVKEGSQSIGSQEIDFANVDRRAVIEYDLSSIPANATITDVKLTLDVGSRTYSPPDTYPMAPLYAYAGDGMIEVSDALVETNLVGVLNITNTGSFTFDLDQHAVQMALEAGGHLGLALHGSPNYKSFSFTSLEGTSPQFSSEPATLQITYTLADSLPGDYNSDGQVNLADYTVWRDSLGTTGEDLAADGNSDSVVDDLDYAMWKEHFGESNSSLETFQATSVPEPVTSLLFGSFCLTALSVARRARAGAGRPRRLD